MWNNDARLLLYCFGKLRHVDEPERPTPVSWSTLLIWTVMPLAILTLNLSKSPVVASVSVTPIVLLATFLLYRVLLASRVSPQLANVSCTACAAVSVFIGMTLMANAEGRPDVHAANVTEVKQLLKAYDDITAYCQRFRLKQPIFVSDRILEYFNGTAAAVIIFERTGLNLGPRELLAYNIWERSTDEVLRVAATADCALVTLDPLEKIQAPQYPFHQSAANWQAPYRNLVTSQMVQIAELAMPGHRFQLFVRPRASIEGDSFGWLTADGARIAAPARVLKALPIVQFFGSTIGSKHLNGPLGTTVTMTADPLRPPIVVPSRATIHPDESYEIRIDLSGAKLPESGQVRMELSFDRYFIPKDLGINPDPRKLVLQFPTSSSLTPAALQTAAPPLQLTVGDLYD